MELYILAYFLLLGSLSEGASKERAIRSTRADIRESPAVHQTSTGAINPNLGTANEEWKAWPFPDALGPPLPQYNNILSQIQNSLADLRTGQNTIVSLVGTVLNTVQRVQQEQWVLKNLFESNSHSPQQYTQIPSPISPATLTNAPKEDAVTTAETSPESPNEAAGESAIDKPPGLEQPLNSYIVGGNGNAPLGNGHWQTVGGGTPGGDGNWWTSVSNGPNGGTTILSGTGVGISANPQNVVVTNTAGPAAIANRISVANTPGVGTAVGGGVTTNSGLSQTAGAPGGIAVSSGPIPYLGGPPGWWNGISTSTNNLGGSNGGFVGVVSNSQMPTQGSGIITTSTFTSKPNQQSS